MSLQLIPSLDLEVCNELFQNKLSPCFLLRLIWHTRRGMGFPYLVSYLVSGKITIKLFNTLKRMLDVHRLRDLYLHYLMFVKHKIASIMGIPEEQLGIDATKFNLHITIKSKNASDLYYAYKDKIRSLFSDIDFSDYLFYYPYSNP